MSEGVSQDRGEAQWSQLLWERVPSEAWSDHAEEGEVIEVIRNVVYKTHSAWYMNWNPLHSLIVINWTLFSMFVMTGIWIDRYNIRQRLQRPKVT